MRFRFFRALFSDLIFIPLVLCFVWNAQLSIYLVRLGKGQMNIVLGARPVKEVLQDAAVPDSVKAKLQLIEEIRQFAFDSIGLKRNENYSTFYDQHGQRLMYVVTACEPYALRPQLWHFPFLGDVPYKGFFNPEKAKAEAEQLRKRGLDADIGGASGWSTLGFFKDPVLSQMLNNNEGELAELIIHELTHGTIFVKNNVEFNENLASFIGYKGALWFLERKYGKASKQYLTYIKGRNDEKILGDFMLHCAHSLDSLYRSFPEKLSAKEKFRLKISKLYAFVNESKTLPLEMDASFPSRFQKRIERSGNAFFMQYVRYGSKQHDFESEYAQYKNLRAYLDWLKTKYLKE